MIKGYITTKHVIRYAVVLIGALGFARYLKVLNKCIFSKAGNFIDMFFE